MAVPAAVARSHAAQLKSQTAVLALYSCAVFVGAALVFLVQPMAARMVLPLFGGSQAVWTTSMLFFQAVLLAGYGFAHTSVRWLGPARQWMAQAAVLLLAVAALPIGEHLSAPPAGAAPALWLLGVLALSIGAPFFVVTTASPVLQRWFSLTAHRSAPDPYFLYAAGNAGSLLALVAYPVLVEPHLSLTEQARLWSVGYGVFAVLSLACVLTVRGAPARTHRTLRRLHAAPLAWRTRLRWIFMAFVPSSLMLGATNHISTDIASVPLLWVAPLATYLLTFIVAFARRPPVSVAVASRALPILAAAVLLTLLGAARPPVPVVLAAHLALLFCAGVLAHGRLAGERPEPEHLTGFYVLLSVGGVLGGAFNALVAPVVFDTVLEYPLAIALALLLRPRARTTRIRELALAPLPLLLCLVALAAAQADVGTVRAILAAAVASLLLFTAWPRGFALAFAGLAAIAVVGGSALYTERTFFGVLRVSEGPRGEHVLAHGTTVHGVQRFRSGGSAEPLSYYSRSGPIGDVFASYARTTPFRRIGVVGLGVGTLAAYGRPGQTFEFYEIDPAVIEVASDPRFFTYLRDSRADVRFTVGDGRRSLAASRDGTRDLIVVDAFSSDSIPVHLLTREAVALYLAKLRPEGLLAVHVSNRHLQLAPVLAGVADSLGVAAAERFERISERDRRSGRNPSHWVVVARSGARLTPLLARRGWRRLRPDGASRVWTDDFSNVLSVIDWSR